MPVSYGLVEPGEGARLLPWSFVTSRMEVARNYWLSTASPDGLPHAAPVWGLWHRESFFFGTDRESRKGRNLLAQPSIVVHLESGDEAVIITGKAGPVKDPDLLAELDSRYFEKYAFHLDPGQTYRIHPTTVLAWLESDFPRTATRWRLSS